MLLFLIYRIRVKMLLNFSVEKNWNKSCCN